MANPEWGTKRICQNCGTKFYDLRREPILCPKCHAEYDPEALLKTRRGRTLPVEKEEAAQTSEAETDNESLDNDLAEDEDEAAEESGGEEEDEDLIEDASELGEDDDDMAEVIENVDDEEEG